MFQTPAATALTEGKIGKSLKKVLKKVVAKDAHEQLAISDAKLGGVIKVSNYIFTQINRIHQVTRVPDVKWLGCLFLGKDGPHLCPQLYCG